MMNQLQQSDHRPDVAADEGTGIRRTESFAISSRYWESRFKESYGAHHDVELRPIDGESGCGIGPAMEKALRSSLPTFQVGESGDGQRLRAGALTTGDSAYCNAIDYFIIEEQEHARLLSLILKDLDQPLRDSHWTDAVFVFLRHRAGLRTELLILMVAELISLGYYGALADGCGPTPVAEVFRRIADDEKRHLDFHLETIPILLRQWSAPLRMVVGLLWGVVAAASALLVAVDHRQVFAACGLPKRRFIARSWLAIWRAGSVLF